MNDQQKLLADTAETLFARLGPQAIFADGIAELDDSGFASLLVAEQDGGFGAGWVDAALVFRLAGYHAVALPVVEVVLAACHAPPGTQGRGSIAVGAAGTLAPSGFTGRLAAVPWGRNADYVVTTLGDDTIMLGRPAGVEPGESPAGEPRDTLLYTDAPALRLPRGRLLLAAAFARTAQIAGGLDAALALSVGYVNDRQQFGRPLAKFQAVQQVLAAYAAEAAAVNCAMMGAAQALDRGHGGDDAAFEVAAAKLRANMAAGFGSATAHQVHGAIGFTADYSLHPLTRRLLSWRSEFGADQYWAQRLGASICARGADRFWADITLRSDAARPPA